ncbi:MAG: ATP/GTP-binding protein [Gammaproteobacteria bacterium]|nr:MAG: ATP/GTP-binding protein [Gammaproteobacteria bacterium]
MVNEDKIIFAGPVGAGKTTALASISDIPPIKTEEKASDETAQRKEMTTVAMDYGVLQLDDDTKIHLYGTPGQERFSFMWPILSIGGIGLILMLDNAREKPLDDLRIYLNGFKDFISRTTAVIGVTRMDVSNKIRLSDYHQVMEEVGIKVPIFEVDAREREDVKLLMISLLTMLDPALQR